LARYRLNTELIANNWDDMLRVAGSLKLGALSASEFMRTIQSGSRTSTLVRAIAELGRIAKTLFLLAYVDDEAYRRRILVQLNRGEGRHRLARAVFHGRAVNCANATVKDRTTNLGRWVLSSMPSFSGTRATSNER